MPTSRLAAAANNIPVRFMMRPLVLTLHWSAQPRPRFTSDSLYRSGRYDGDLRLTCGVEKRYSQWFAILYVPAVELGGWLPPELQSYIWFTGTVGSAAKELE